MGRWVGGECDCVSCGGGGGCFFFCRGGAFKGPFGVGGQGARGGDPGRVSSGAVWWLGWAVCGPGFFGSGPVERWAALAPTSSRLPGGWRGGWGPVRLISVASLGGGFGAVGVGGLWLFSGWSGGPLSFPEMK